MSCSMIHFLMFAFTASVNVIFPVASVSLPRVSDWPEKTAIIQVIVLVQASHLWVKYLFFSNMMFCCMSWSGSVQVYNRFTRDFWGYLCPRFLLENPQSENLTYHPWSFLFLSRFKKTYCFQLFHFLKFTDYLVKLNKCKRLFRI